MVKIPSAFVMLPAGLVCMMAITAFAFVADCVRLDNAASGVVSLADQDLLAIEQRMVQLLTSSPNVSDESLGTIKAYDTSTVPAERHNFFMRLVQTFESQADLLKTNENETNMRATARFIDEGRGVANRWTVSMQLYKTQVDKHNQYRQSKRGKVAAWFIVFCE